ncbi:hypothetical protein HT031_006630 [Scenedesmus sp. PABB004]|nr:hypothetical protein HT031_006630 [Scenedesmus sp. PABB004]
MAAAGAGGAGANTDLELYTRLNTELVSLVEHMTNLVKATRDGLDGEEGGGGRGDGGSAGRERRVPGELLEVMAERLLAAGHQCVQTVSTLKRGAVVSDVDALMANLHAVGSQLAYDRYNVGRGLEQIKRDAEVLLSELEEHWYASEHKGALPAAAEGGGARALAELCSEALTLTGG